MLSIGGVFVAIFGGIIFTLTYRAPSCSDGRQNQGELGIDCGGPCSNLCSALEDAPTVLSTRAIPNGAGRTDVLAFVENQNANAAARAVPYTITLYDASHSLIQRVEGTVDLPPSSTVPVYVPGVASGNQVVASAFLSIDATAIPWFTYTETRALPSYNNDATLTNATAAPRITATLSNAMPTPVQNVHVIVAVYNAAGNVIAASATLIPSIPAQGRATATFTWNQPFAGNAASIGVLPVTMLP